MASQRVLPSAKQVGIKSWVIQSWWMILFTGGCFFIYSQAMQKKSCIAKALQDQLEMLDQQKLELLAQREDLLLQINSQSDPAWIELTLMKGLGLVPEGQTKVFFQNESKDPVKETPAA